MEILLFTSIFVLILTNLFFVYKFLYSQKLFLKEESGNSVLSERVNNLNNILKNQSNKIDFLEKENNNSLIFKGKFNQSEQLTLDLKNQIEKDREKLDSYNKKILEFEKENILISQEKENLKDEKKEWNNKKQQILLELSEELIKKNNLQQDSFGKKQKEVIEETVFNLNTKFSNILNKVSSLDDDVKKTFNDINFTKNALLTPGGAGRVSEITLENILKSSGLKQKNSINESGDYILQSHFFDENKNLKRPDAMVFLPQNQILIIDSKSSSHFLELQQSLDDNDQKAKKLIESKIKDSMKRHLEELKKRDYSKAKLHEFDLKEINNSQDSPIINTIMFLQTEKMLEIIRNVDQNFERKALEVNIQILSPVGLINLLYQAKFLIKNVKQEKNIEKLKVEIRKLMESIGSLFKKSETLGNSIKKSFNSYNDFVGTFNSRFLPRISNMNKLGIESKNDIERLKKINYDNNLIEIEDEGYSEKKKS